jgi:hypothetical protein
MREEQAALLAPSHDVRAAAHAAREQSAATRRAAEETRRRLGAHSMELRALAVRRLRADGGPDAQFWVDRALRPRGAPPAQAASETARSAAPTSRA